MSGWLASAVNDAAFRRRRATELGGVGLAERDEAGPAVPRDELAVVVGHVVVEAAAARHVARERVAGHREVAVGAVEADVDEVRPMMVLASRNEPVEVRGFDVHS